MMVDSPTSVYRSLAVPWGLIRSHRPSRSCQYIRRRSKGGEGTLTDLSPGDDTPFDDHIGSSTERVEIPKGQIGHTSHLDLTDQV